MVEVILDDPGDANAEAACNEVRGLMHPSLQFTGLTPAGGTWYDLATWPANTGTTGGLSAKIGVRMSNGTANVDQFDVEVVAGYGLIDGTMSVMNRQGDWPEPESVQLRLIFETADTQGPARLQMFMNSNQTIRGVLHNQNSLTRPTGSTWGTMAPYTPTGSEVVIASIDMSNWQSANVTMGTSGAIRAGALTDPTNGIGFDLSTGTEAIVQAGGVDILRSSNLGLRVGTNEYGSWVAPTSTDWPIDATIWTNLIAQQRPTLDDGSLNPSSTVTLSAVNAGGVTAETMTGFDAGHRGLRFGTAGSGGMTMTFAGCLSQRIIFTGTFGVATSSGGTTQDYEVVDSDGAQVAAWTIPDPGNDVGSVHTFSFEFNSGVGDEVYTIRKRSTGTSQAVYMFNYSMTVAVDEPALETNTALQVDSPLKGVLLPRVLPTSSVTHPQGTIALDGLAKNRPIWHDSTDFAYINTTRIGFRSVDTGQFFFAEGGTFADAGWTGSNHNRLVHTENFQGFPAVVRCTQSGGTITIQAPNNTQALWDTAFANGFRVDYRMMFGATFDGSVWMDIEPNNTSWGATGRFEANITVNGGQLQMTCINTGGNTTFDIERDTMYTISMTCEPGALTASMLIDGAKVGEVTYGGTGSTERGTFFYIPPGNPVNDFSFQSITMYTLDAAASDITFDRTAIETGLRYNVPNINSSMRMRVPKGLYDFGNTLTVVNGSNQSSFISGLDDDKQLFGGVPVFEIPPNTEITFTEAGFPRGCEWSASGGKIVINHNENASAGHSIILNIDGATGNVEGRHGNYTGDLVVTRVSAGQYTIAPGATNLADSTSVLATIRGATPGEVRTSIGLGEVFVDTLSSDGVTPTDLDTSVSIYW